MYFHSERLPFDMTSTLSTVGIITKEGLALKAILACLDRNDTITIHIYVKQKTDRYHIFKNAT